MKRIGISLLLSIVLLLPAQVHAQATSARVVVIGSSTAEGCCAPGGQGWVALYKAYLLTKGASFEVINIAMGGATTFDVLPTGYVSPYRSLRTEWNIAPNSSINITKALSLNPTHIIINLPTNDAALNVPIAYQLAHYAEILSRARAQGVPVWITTTQPRNLGVTQRQLLKDMRDATFYTYGSYAIDFWNGLANADGTIMSAYDYDGTHLNAAGHAILFERVRAALSITPISTTGNPVATGNLVANGGFEGGTASWSFFTNGAGTFGTVAGGTEGSSSAKIAISVEGTNVQLNQVGVTLESYTKYQLSFDAYSTSGHDVSVSLLKNVSPYTNYGLSGVEFDSGTGWKRCTATFTTGALGGTVTDGRLMFWLAPYDAGGDVYYFDNIVLSKGDASAATGPSITSQPSNQAVVAGQTATFGVGATGTALLQYQWQKNSVNIAGATGSSYTTPALALSDQGSTYRVIVSNTVGSVTSNAATLTVSAAAVTVPSGGGNVLANGGFEGGTTSWNFYTNGAATFGTVAGGTEGSSSAKIAISVEGTNVQMHQMGVTLESYTKYQLSFDAYSTSGHDVSVSLMKNVAPYTNYGLSGVEFDLGTWWKQCTATFTTGALGGTVTDGRLMFWLAPYDAGGDVYYFDNIVLSKADASAAVATGPSITSQPSNQVVVAGQTATFGVGATGTAPLQYQWQKNSVNITGATGSSYTTPALALSDQGSSYRVIVSNTVGSVTSNAATLTVSAAAVTVPSGGGNILANGGFEGGTSSWNFYTSGVGTFGTVAGGTEGSSSAKIAISVEGTNVQMHQVGMSLESYTKYQLSFDAYSTSGHDVSVSLLKNVSPYSNYGLSGVEFDLGTSWKHCTATFKTDALGGTVTDGRLMFWLAPYDAGGDVYFFDNIVLSKTDASVAAAGPKVEIHEADEPSPNETIETIPTQLQLHQNFPNPFNPSTTITFDLPAQSNVTLTVYDVLGREVETLLQGERPAGTYRIRWDAQGVSTGVYFCRLQVDAAGAGRGPAVLSRKLILSK